MTPSTTSTPTAMSPPGNERWRPIAAIAGIVFVLAVIATVVIVNGGDSASTSATVVVPPSRSDRHAAAWCRPPCRPRRSPP